MIGMRNDHLLFIVGCTVIYFFNETSRKLVIGFGFILIYWVLFDSVRVYPNYLINTLHISEPYLFEKAWFGIQTASGVLTPNEYWGLHYNTFLDIYTAITYICWIPIPMAFSLWLFFTKRRHALVNFQLTFLIVSQLGLMFQYLYPAAPPWYVELYGFAEHFNIPGNPGRLVNFDRFFNVNVFSKMYGLNGNVYAAIPSMHCAFPVVQLFFAWKYKLRFWGLLFIVLMLSTWFSAVYTNHHYTIDVITGVATAILAVTVYSQILLRTRVKDFLNRLGKRIS